MGERDDARREVRVARERLSDLALELSHRANPEHLKERAKELAAEKAEEWKGLAKETAMRRTTQWKQEATRSPKGLGLLGSIAGAVIGSMVAKRLGGRVTEQRDYRLQGYAPPEGLESPRYSSRVREGYESPMREQASQKAADVRERAEDVAARAKEKASEAVESVRERLPDREELQWKARSLKYRANSWYDRMIDEQPVLLAIGAVGLGLVCAALLPVSAGERRLVAPAKEKLKEQISSVGERIEHKLSEEGATEQGAQAAEHSPSAPPTETTGEFPTRNL